MGRQADSAGEGTGQGGMPASRNLKNSDKVISATEDCRVYVVSHGESSLESCWCQSQKTKKDGCVVQCGGTEVGYSTHSFASLWHLNKDEQA